MDLTSSIEGITPQPPGCGVMPFLFNRGRRCRQLIPTILFEGFIMRPSTSPLEHLTAFAIVFATGILAAASFVAYMERVRRNAILDHCMRSNSESNLSASPTARRSIDG